MITAIVLIILLFCLGAMYLMGRRARRHIRGFQDAIAAPRQASLLLLVGSAVGGQIGSGFVMGGGEYGAQYGLAGAWYGIGCGLSYFVTGALARFIHENRLVSLSDYFTRRYRGRSIRLIYSVTGILSCIAMLSGQLLAARAILVTLGLPPRWGVLFIAVLSLVYANASGLLGTMAVSSLQSAILFFGMAAALLTMYRTFGPEVLTQLPPAALKLLPRDGELAFSMAGPIILASGVNQISFQSVTSARSLSTARRGYVLAGLLLIPCAFVPPLLGMYGRCLFPRLPSSQVLTGLLLDRLPAGVTALLFAAVLCAVIVSCSSAYIAVGTNAVHDIYRGMVNRDARSRDCRILMALVDAGVCLLGILFALRMNDIIQILSVGYSLLAAGCLAPFLGGILWKRGSTAGALASAGAGIGACLLDFFGVISPPFSSLFCVLVSFLVFFSVSALAPEDGGRADKSAQAAARREKAL